MTLQQPSLFVDRVTDFSATFMIALTTFDHWMTVEQPSLTDCRFASMHVVLSTYRCVCVDCAKKVKNCPLCKKHIRQGLSVRHLPTSGRLSVAALGGRKGVGCEGGGGDVIELSDNDEWERRERVLWIALQLLIQFGKYGQYRHNRERSRQALSRVSYKSM